LPDEVLMPWLPGLILMLRPHMGSVLPNLLKEASACFPASLAALDTWQPPWQAATVPVVQPVVTAAVERTPQEIAVYDLLATAPAGCEGLARLLGIKPEWRSPVTGPALAAVQAAAGSETQVAELLRAHPLGLMGLAKLAGVQV
jgi:hypothetical protein